MEDLEQKLEKIGLSGKKAKIYLALLEVGEARVSEIAKKASLKRTTVYNILPELITGGLVKRTMKGKRSFFFVDDPRMLKTGFDEKARTVEQILPELQALHNVLPNKPRITFYEGAGGMRDLYKDTLESTRPGDTILSYTGLSDFYKFVPEDFARDYIAERVKRKVRIQVITPGSPVAALWEKNKSKELREIKIVHNADAKFNADMEIYGNKVAFISYRENFLGVIIESKEINQMQKAAFQIMWDALS